MNLFVFKSDGIPIGGLRRIRAVNASHRAWVDEQDFIREAIRRRLEELGLTGYPGSSGW